ncbi:hypothetical protein [Gulosibacter faecalis]|jgi:hypothetical protein|uniref:Uncharacterized protein n=1 Tax=Gulosibacter faecalis TaxID=272240 RepID=A0ABW5UWW5_9MICO|nr:hypothetical protein [Gulosibacter faecalis]
MNARRVAPPLALVATVAVTLLGCAAATGSGGDPIATSTETFSTAGPGTPSTPAETPIETPEGLPAGATVDPVTGVWIYSDAVAFSDLPQDPDEFLSEPLDSLPELPSIPSLAGQELADENGLVDVWDLQQYYLAHCMAEAGFEWRWTYGDESYSELGDAIWPEGYVIPGTWDDPTPGFQEALWGENDFDDESYVYSWDTAGCDGYAVHVTGMDDAH